MVTLFKLKDRKTSLGLFGFITLGFVPYMLAFNIWGNSLIQRIEVENKCEYIQTAQSFELLYLISIYCTIFIFAVFVLVVRECMRRFYLSMEINPAILRSAFNPSGFDTHVVRGRSLEDWQDALAYALWFLTNGRVGSRAEQNFLEDERGRRSFRKMSNCLRSYSFEEGDIENTFFCDGFSAQEETSAGLGARSPDKQPGLTLNSSFNSVRSSSSDSVKSRSDGHGSFLFKYKHCSICLTDFKQGEVVKVVPLCGHTFHKKCLEQWLVLRFRCPNCNVEIDTSEANQETSPAL